MIELPETYVLAEQINRTLAGKTIQNATANASPHKFAWYSGDPAAYQQKLAGKTVISASPGTGYTCGGNTEIVCGDMLLVISTPIRYHAPGEKLPAKHQLWLEFEDFSGDGTSSMTFIPMAEPRSCASGFFCVLTSMIQSALRPSSVSRPKLGTKPAMEPIMSMIPELRLQRAPRTELA